MLSNEKWINEAWEKVVDKISKSSIRIGDTFPHVSKNGKYDSERVGWWTAGFWPGLLWLVYNETGDGRLKEIAISCEQQLDKPLHDFLEIHHDVGFMWIPTALNHYKHDKSEESRRRVLTAASHLAGRFNIKGNFIRAWNNAQNTTRAGWAIIDCMMNIPLLLWASEETVDPRFRHIAMAHADTVIKEFIRPDGSVNHIVSFDPETGERVEAIGGQGYAPDSAWARGAAWAIYGMALIYRYTREQRYLDAAKSVSHFFIANLNDDFIPNWDFRAPIEDPMPLDTSAAACAASGFLEISNLVDPSERDLYYKAGVKIVKSLYENCGAWDSEEEALVMKGTVHRPANKNVNIPIIYGDFFFVEALLKLKGTTSTCW